MIHILAQTARLPEQQFKHLQDRFSESDPTVPIRIVIVICLLVIAVFLVWLLAHLQQRRQLPSRPQPMRMYLRLQRKLRLPLVDTIRMWHLATVVEVEHPTVLLISPTLFDDAAERFCKTSGFLGSRADAAGALAAIRKRLFRHHSS